MEKYRVAVIGVGSIAQVIHLPLLKKMEEVELIAICDIDEAKVNAITERYSIPRWYFLIDDLVRGEKLDAVFICTTSHYHYPMTYLALSKGIHVFVEKPIALNAREAEKVAQLAAQKQLTVMVGMQNRFRDDVITLKEFIKNDELGEIYYIKAGWLKQWTRTPPRSWQVKKEYSGGGALMDIGMQLIDLALFLTELPPIKSVRLYDYSHTPDLEVEDTALAVIETQSGSTITIEISWRMHMEKDVLYTHIFGKKGAAYLNPLRIHKELHGNLVNVTPVIDETNADRYIKAYEHEIRHFFHVMRGEEENLSSAKDAFYIMHIIDALYQSAKTGKEVQLV